MAELPGGTVTFLFTDIEGSTRLLSALGRERFGELMAVHSRLLREEIAASAGEVVDTHGDAFFAVFRTSVDAVAGAVAAQRALFAHSWPEGCAIRVRMGIHTGEAVVSEERYVGLSVHRASRIGAAAHGGQVLLSNTTRELVEDDLPEGISLRDLGVHRLKDLERPEHLTQLTIPGLPDEFPPVRTVADETPFAGQEDALAVAAQAAVTGPRLQRRRALLAGTLIIAAAVAVALTLVAGRRTGSASAAVSPNSVAVIDPRGGKVVADVPVGTRPGPIAAGAGAVWVGNLDDKTVTHIDAATRKVLGSVSLEATPTGVAAAGNRVWVVTGDPGLGHVYRIDPQYNTVTGTVRLAASYYPGSYAERAIAAEGGQVWVAGYDGTAQRIDPSALRVQKRIVVGNEFLPGIALGFGSTWVVSESDKTITRIDRTGIPLPPIPFGDEPSAIAVGAGAVWVADRWDDRVARIDPTKGDVEDQIPVGEHPTGVAVGAGRVWVANSRSGTVSEIDSATNKVAHTIQVGGSPTGIAVANGLLWVTVAATARAALPVRAGDVAHLELPALAFSSLDPAQAYDTQTWQVLQATCLKLVNYPDTRPVAGSPVVPDASRSMPSVTNGGKTYTFTIRRSLRFSPPSNEPVTAETFKESIERALDPQTRGPAVYTGYVDAIVGAKAFEHGKAKHVAGIVARRQTLTITLTEPVGDLPARLPIPFFCAVPIDTPPDPNGLPSVPSAGPYYIASDIPGEQVILKRNPNYTGLRPHHLAEIDVQLDVGPARSMSDVERGIADYNFGALANPAGDAARLRKLYGPPSLAARSGHQRWFAHAALTTLWITLNTRRPLFASRRMRQAINFAIDRTALAHLYTPTALPTAGYLPPGIPGYRNEPVYPVRPDLAEARRLAGAGERRTAVVYTSASNVGRERAEVVRQGLAALGIAADIHVYPIVEYYKRIGAKGQPWDVAAAGGWNADYVDPGGMLSLPFDGRLVAGGANPGDFDDREVNRRLDAAARLRGAARYRAYGRLAFDLARTYAPVIAYGVGTVPELFSSRMGCQVFQPINGGTDLAALCIK